jgi:hypothetical protein
MNILSEYERLCVLSETIEGWEQIQEAWNLACNMKKSGEDWFESESKGQLVEGFAIDSKTKKFFCGTINDHSWAYFKLYEYLLKNEENTSCDDVEERIIKGWRGKILDFQEPCVFVASIRFFYEPDFLKEIEESILEQESGLPVSGLFLKKLKR